MAIEIERKFIVSKELLPTSIEQIPMQQGYLNDDPNRLVRVRIAGEKAFLTIKGKGTGIARPEFEYEIPLTDAKELLEMAIYAPINKVRHIIYHEGNKWEVDIFIGKNEGLVMAEIELEHEYEKVVLPDWIEKEVTGDNRFFNYQLSKQPFKDW